MTPEQLRALGTALTGYLELFANCFVHERTVRHLHGDCRGLLSDLPRKSIEPMALACGTAVRTLQEQLGHDWCDRRDLDGQERCQDAGGASAMVRLAGQDRELPGHGASGDCARSVQDPGRCRSVLAESLERGPQAMSGGGDSRGCGVSSQVADRVGATGAGGVQLAGIGLGYVRRILRKQAGVLGVKGKRVDNLTKFSPTWNRQEWHGVSLARLTLDNQTWEVRTGQVYLVRDGTLAERKYSLIVATGEVKYFLSNAPPDTPVEKLLRVGFSRWNVEHAFRVVKTEIGFSHFEGRSYAALMRHTILCLVVMGFVAEPTDRLWGEKSGDHFGAGLPGVEPTLPDLAEAAAGDDG